MTTTASVRSARLERLLRTLTEYKRDLQALGFATFKVDELRNEIADVRVRFNYAGGEWRIIVSDRNIREIRLDLRSDPPTASELIQATLGRVTWRAATTCVARHPLSDGGWRPSDGGHGHDHIEFRRN